ADPNGSFGNPNFTGNITINSGILANGNAPGAANSAALGSGMITLAGGELRSQGSATFVNPISVTADSTITPKPIAGGTANTSMILTGNMTSTGTPGLGNGPVLTIGNAGSSSANVQLKGSIS